MKLTKIALSALSVVLPAFIFSACGNTTTVNTNKTNTAVVTNNNSAAVNNTIAPVSNAAVNNTAPLANTASNEKKDIFQLISKDKEISEYLKDSKGGADALAKTMSVKNTDLNADGQPEFIVMLEDEQLCGAHGNCPNWVYQKTGGEYKLLLRTRGESLTVEKASTNKFTDLRSEGSNSAVELGVTIYKFDGSKYQPKVCFNEVSDGKSDKPKIVTLKCQADS